MNNKNVFFLLHIAALVSMICTLLIKRDLKGSESSRDGFCCVCSDPERSVSGVGSVCGRQVAQAHQSRRMDHAHGKCFTP